MPQEVDGFRIEEFPASRLGTIDVCELGRSRHHMVALAELDVTEARAAMHAQRPATGAPLSFTGWVVACVARAASEYPHAHALYAGGRRLAVFSGVDITVLVERLAAGERVPLPYVLRGAEQKSVAEVSAELRRAQEEPLEKGQTVIGDPSSGKAARLYERLPGMLRRIFWRRLLRSPGRAGKTMGTISVTSVGGFGRLGGWLIPISIFPLTVGLGPVVRKPVVVGDKVEIRQILHATLLIDHDVIDGLPALRFASRLAHLVEHAWGLESAAG